MLLITDAQIITPTGVLSRGWLATDEAGRIAALATGDAPHDWRAGRHVIAANGLTLLPGFIDLHVHGALNHETMDATPQALVVMAGYYARHGVTGFLATTWSDTHEHILAALENISRGLGARPDGAALLGAHLEGPFLNPAMCGAQSADLIRHATPDDALPLLDTGVVRLLSLAPEYPENRWLIVECVRRGIVAAAAHTTATYEQMCAAIDAGLNHATHTYNAMSGLHHRAPGTLGAALVSPQVNCELIADNVHVHPGAMRLLWQVKGRDRVILITDAVRAAGMPDGEYPLDERSFRVVDGVPRLEDGTLAGSTLTLNRGLANLMQATGAPLAEVWPASSLNAARALRLDYRKGSLAVGKDADLALIDDQVNVYLTVVNGQVVYSQFA